MVIKNIIVVDGDERHLMLQKCQEVIQAVLPSEDQRAWGLEKYIGEAVTLEQMSQALQSTIAWAPKKLVHVENPQFLENSEQAETWLELFQNIAEGVSLLIFKEGKVDGRKKVGQWLIKNTNYFNFQKINEWENDKYITFIQAQLKPYAYPSEFPARLYEKVGPDLSLLVSEITKLKTFAGESQNLTITVLDQITSAGVSKSFILAEYLRRADWHLALKQIHAVLQNEAPQMILGLLVSQFRLMIQLRSMLSDRLSFEEMGKQLQKNPFYLKRIVADMPAKLDIPFLKNVYACLADLDAGYKNGQYSGSLPMLNKLAGVLLVKKSDTYLTQNKVWQ